MKLRLIVQHDPATQRWSGTFPEIPECATAGDTEQEAIANAKEALTLGSSRVILISKRVPAFSKFRSPRNRTEHAPRAFKVTNCDLDAQSDSVTGAQRVFRQTSDPN